MEFTAWFAHKHVMHGFLWNLHEDHHVQTPGFFQKNDFFFLIFAVPSAVFIVLGVSGITPMLFAGLGIAFYGLAYFLFHEVLIHRRYRGIRKLLFDGKEGRYLKLVQFAHRRHHSRITKENGEAFGMLWVPKKYILQYDKRK